MQSRYDIDRIIEIDEDGERRDSRMDEAERRRETRLETKGQILGGNDIADE